MSHKPRWGILEKYQIDYINQEFLVACYRNKAHTRWAKTKNLFIGSCYWKNLSGGSGLG